MDLDDLRAVIEDGGTIEEAAEFLCRSGTVGEVRDKAREFGTRQWRKGSSPIKDPLSETAIKLERPPIRSPVARYSMGSVQ
jgi:hypothetical protein